MNYIISIQQRKIKQWKPYLEREQNELIVIDKLDKIYGRKFYSTDKIFLDSYLTNEMFRELIARCVEAPIITEI